MFDPLEFFNLISPAVFFFGLTGAFVINLLIMFSIRLWKEKSTIQSDISFKPKAVNLFVSALSFTTLLIMLIYAFLENFIIR